MSLNPALKEQIDREVAEHLERIKRDGFEQNATIKNPNHIISWEEAAMREMDWIGAYYQQRLTGSFRKIPTVAIKTQVFQRMVLSTDDMILIRMMNEDPDAAAELGIVYPRSHPEDVWMIFGIENENPAIHTLEYFRANRKNADHDVLIGCLEKVNMDCRKLHLSWKAKGCPYYAVLLPDDFDAVPAEPPPIKY